MSFPLSFSHDGQRFTIAADGTISFHNAGVDFRPDGMALAILFEAFDAALFDPCRVHWSQVCIETLTGARVIVLDEWSGDYVSPDELKARDIDAAWSRDHVRGLRADYFTRANLL